MTSADPVWQSTVRRMRVLCPLTAVLSLALALSAWGTGNEFSVTVAAFCAGINAMLTWIQWRVFEI